LRRVPQKSKSKVVIGKESQGTTQIRRGKGESNEIGIPTSNTNGARQKRKCRASETTLRPKKERGEEFRSRTECKFFLNI